MVCYAGFASSADGVLKGNYGLWDQAMAMQFCRNHIQHFGGDPNQITIFGQSAGAGSIGAHLVSPISGCTSSNSNLLLPMGIIFFA